MNRSAKNRRVFLNNLGGVVGAGCLAGSLGKADRSALHIACNEYPWMTFYQRENLDFKASLDDGLAEVAASGIDGYEPLVTTPQEIDVLIPLLRRHGLQMRSLYVNSILHKRAERDASVEQVLNIAEKAKICDTQIIVTNPSPLPHGTRGSKNDQELEFQASALDQLGAELRKRGFRLAYHNHDVELRNAAREFHHMMLATQPENVSLCLDAHWIYRGSGNSSIALFDVLKLYGERISELHLRQSVDQIWCESLRDGDIDYPRLIRFLRDRKVRPHCVLEQAVEEDSPQTMKALEAHRRSQEFARRLLSAFG